MEGRKEEKVMPPRQYFYDTLKQMFSVVHMLSLRINSTAEFHSDWSNGSIIGTSVWLAHRSA